MVRETQVYKSLLKDEDYRNDSFMSAEFYIVLSTYLPIFVFSNPSNLLSYSVAKKKKRIYIYSPQKHRRKEIKERDILCREEATKPKKEKKKTKRQSQVTPVYRSVNPNMSFHIVPHPLDP